MAPVLENVFGVGAFRCGGQTQEDSGQLSKRVGLIVFEDVFEQPPIRRRRRMMKFVDNQDFERGRIELPHHYFDRTDSATVNPATVFDERQSYFESISDASGYQTLPQLGRWHVKW